MMAPVPLVNLIFRKECWLWESPRGALEGVFRKSAGRSPITGCEWRPGDDTWFRHMYFFLI